MNAPASLEIKYEQKKPDSFTGLITALFNPNQLAYTSTVNWQRVEGTLASKNAAAGTNKFLTVSAETLTVDLFFDTYAPYGAAAGGTLGLVGAQVAEVESVTRYTDQVMRLATIDADLHRPPVCQISWGRNSYFTGVCQRATRTYTLFLQDGTPVRATMQCTFMDAPKGATAGSELYSSDVAKRYVIRPNDTLMGIAAQFYGDGSRWRVIADANGLEDPRRLTPGRTLAIPRIR